VIFFYKLAQAGQDAYFRRIEFYDEERDRVLVFLTNHLELAAATVAAIYKERWQIELFFRALKQSLRVKTFVGTSANALKTQLWTALIAMLLVKYLQLRSTFGWSLSNLVALYGSSYLFTVTCGLGSTTLSNRRRYQLACRNSWRCSWPKRPIGWTAAISHITKKRVTARFQGEEFRQHRIRNKPSKPPTCSPSRRFGGKFAFILGKSAANSHLIGTALMLHKCEACAHFVTQ